MASSKEIKEVVETGLVFHKTSARSQENTGKVKTKAKKKSYITGLHHSASSKKKATIRIKRANRHKN